MSKIDPNFIARHLDGRIKEAMLDTPAILVNGPRQCGKTTLVRQHASNDRPYFSLGERVVRFTKNIYMKSCLFQPCVVVRRCHSYGYGATSRLAWLKNPSISFCQCFDETDY